MRLILLFFLALMLSGAQLFAQSRITGKIFDSKTQEALIGATVVVKGSTVAASASLDGSFKITLPAPGSGVLVFSYIGYISKEIPVSESKNLGSVLLVANSSSLNEVVINAPAIDRKTPIAVSTVNAEFIEEKGSGVDFPQLLKETPGVMVTENGGGYGDSRISIRGFSANNVAVLINGIPVNDVENGRVYWSDWAGLTDITSSIQVQRGIGASKVAAPSLGGTIAITTRSLDAQPGGTLIGSAGSFNANKEGVSVSSGLSDKGWATSFLLSRTNGDGIAQGLYFNGYSYFANVSKLLTKSQTLSLNIMGAAQLHGQRYNKNLITTYKNATQGPQYNSDWGYYNGQVQSAEINYYNKPAIALNHIWTINSSSSLSTVAQASFGTGASRYVTNASASPYKTLLPNKSGEYPRTGDAYSPVDFDALVKNNMANGDGSSLNYFQNVANSHQQYNVLSTYKKNFSDNLDLMLGADLRYYEGQHYYQMQDLLGGQYVYDPRTTSNSSGVNAGSGDINNPYHKVVVGDRFNRNYQFDVGSIGLFSQVEYTKKALTVFASGAISNTGNKRIDYFNYLNADPNRESKYIYFLGLQAKGGANYNLDNNNNVFFNIGFLQRAPLVANVFVNNNNSINTDAVPEKLMSYELGYGFRSAELTGNVNLYRSTYHDKSVAPVTEVNTDGSVSSVNLSGLNELHQGVEFNLNYKPNRAISFRGMFSVGKWTYLSDTGPIQVISDNGFPNTLPSLHVKGLNVGDAAQTTGSFGADWYILPKVKINPVVNYYANYTANFYADNITGANYVPYKIPNYTLYDLNIVFRFKFAGLDASFIGNCRNLFNTAYISDALDSSGLNNTASTIGVYYGTGRTYTTTLRIKF
ncbi:outer membrane receptor protein involved in Fe transport [Mucilaginibacter gracilis]|uniref:Outer membrane receptor protein involved in Fe transport n=1 Tax=Mucilaginibacter gracilis TaxID=423350 RepID=A0A495J629_9SPHI|nr:TonB-dependent receptor plug domain-containing protein [Mucilaginibacter gracilis]RKR84450.1 outer membrane receptor protein involved in Fe transport [Mucilaginibacter gracilis]